MVKMIQVLILAVMAAGLSFTAEAVEIKPFTTDGCSSFPDGTIDQQSLWVSCCIRHDLAYWQGGTEEQRTAADLALKQCVEQVGEPKIAKLMLAGVRVGGSPYLPTPFRWGYGWPYLHGYGALTAEEKAEIQRKLEMLALMIQTIADGLQQDIGVEQEGNTLEER